MGVIHMSPTLTRFKRKYCPRTYTAAIIAGILLVIIVRHFYSGSGGWGLGWMTYNQDEEFDAPEIEFPARNQFAAVLRERADEANTVMLAMVDVNFVSTAMNFYVTSIKKHHLRNIVFIATDSHSCDILGSSFKEAKSTCFPYKTLSHNPDTTPAPYSIIRKDTTYLRRFFTLEALKLNYNVIQLDLDLIFLHNPLPVTIKACGKCDIAIMWDSHLDHYDPGYVFARPTDKSVTLFNRLATLELSHGAGKLALNAALKEPKGSLRSLKVVKLDEKQFQVGYTFFPGNACPATKNHKGVMVVHNNYIQHPHNKNYRLKECLMWNLDGYNKYYSNTTRKYISVGMAGTPGHEEHQTLLNLFVLARLLKRTVILPKLQCVGKNKPQTCNILTRMYSHMHIDYIRRFDRVTGYNYRESSFLQNPLVPTAVRNSVSPVLHIAYKDDNSNAPAHGEPIKHYIPNDLNGGPTDTELIKWFGARTENILRFDSLLGWFAHINFDELVGRHMLHVIREL